MIRNPIHLGRGLMLLVLVSLLSGCAGFQAMADANYKNDDIKQSVKAARGSVQDGFPAEKKAEIYALCDEAIALSEQAMRMMTVLANHMNSPWLVGDPGYRESDLHVILNQARSMAYQANRLAETAYHVWYREEQDKQWALLWAQSQGPVSETTKQATQQTTSVSSASNPFPIAPETAAAAGLSTSSLIKMSDALNVVSAAATNHAPTTTIGITASPIEINHALNVAGPVTAADIAIGVDQDIRIIDDKKESQLPQNAAGTINFPWIDAGQLTLLANIPTSGLATYNGQLSGNSSGPGGLNAVSGTINLTVDFAALQTPGLAAINTTLTFNNGMGSASGVLHDGALGVGSNGLAGTFQGENIITGALRSSSFFGPNANELGGNWDVQTNSTVGSGSYKSAR